MTTGSLLDTAQSLTVKNSESLGQVVPFAAEAAWATGSWDALHRFLDAEENCNSHDFNTQVGRLFRALKTEDSAIFDALLSDMRCSIATSMTSASTTSLATAHPATIKLHALYEIEQIGVASRKNSTSDQVVERMNKRLDLLGAFTADKQYLLGIRRAAMQLSKFVQSTSVSDQIALT